MTDEQVRPSPAREPAPERAARELVVRGAPVRCPFCHDEVVVADDAWVACAGCLARHHAPCWDEGQRCAACGAEEPLVARAGTVRPEAGWREAPGPRLAPPAVRSAAIILVTQAGALALLAILMHRHPATLSWAIVVQGLAGLALLHGARRGPDPAPWRPLRAAAGWSSLLCAALSVLVARMLPLEPALGITTVAAVGASLLWALLLLLAGRRPGSS